MTSIRVGLASQTAAASFADIQRVAAALNTQAQRDLGPIWGIDATVEPLEDASKVPTGMQPIFVVDNTPHNVGGLHTDSDGRPFAIVLVTRDWGLGASHECIELLIDPKGDRMKEGIGLQIGADFAIHDSPDRVQYLVEACDPLEDPSNSYLIGDVRVSDFYTPDYFDDAAQPGKTYSFNRSLVRPRQIALNGYISWLNPKTGRMQQLRWFDTGPHLFDLPDHTSATTQDGMPLRQFVDRHTVTPRQRRV